MAGCFLKTAGDAFCGDLWLPGGPYSGSNYVSAPYIRVKFSEGEITVGNKSCPAEGNSAAVKSFEYDSVDGFKCKLEIVDVEGGSHQKLFTHLMKCVNKSSLDAKISVDWGWIYRDCGGKVSTWGLKDTCSGMMQFYLTKIDAEVNNGIFRYMCEGVDIGHAIDAQALTQTWGAEDDVIDLETALEKLAKCPPECIIEFQDSNNEGETLDDYVDFDKEPEDGTWRANLQNKLVTVKTWIKQYTVKDGMGLTIVMDGCIGEGKPKIIIRPDPIDKKGDATGKCLGTFIVNGGKCSSVLDFKPKWQWIASVTSILTTAAGMAGGRSGMIVNEHSNPGQDSCASPEANPTEECNAARGTEDAEDPHDEEDEEDRVAKAQIASQRANSWLGIHPIEADMKITGNPSKFFVNPMDYIGSYVSVLFINPFNKLSSSVGGQCGEFLAGGGDIINAVLTNKQWMLKGVQHSIRDGTYATTLKLFLSAPGNHDAKSSGMGDEVEDVDEGVE